MPLTDFYILGNWSYSALIIFLILDQLGLVSSSDKMLLSEGTSILYLLTSMHCPKWWSHSMLSLLSKRNACMCNLCRAPEGIWGMLCITANLDTLPVKGQHCLLKVDYSEHYYDPLGHLLFSLCKSIAFSSQKTHLIQPLQSVLHDTDIYYKTKFTVFGA